MKLKTRAYEWKYNFSVRRPIDYRYLSFKHPRILHIIYKIRRPWNRLIDANGYHGNRIDRTYRRVRYYYWKGEGFLECKEVKRQYKEAMEMSYY